MPSLTEGSGGDAGTEGTVNDCGASAYTVTVSEDGPLLVSGDVTLRRMTITPEGRHYVYVDEGVIEHGREFSLCRCGHSAIKPLCDSEHAFSHWVEKRDEPTTTVD